MALFKVAFLAKKLHDCTILVVKVLTADEGNSFAAVSQVHLV